MKVPTKTKGVGADRIEPLGLSPTLDDGTSLRDRRSRPDARRLPAVSLDDRQRGDRAGAPGQARGIGPGAGHVRRSAAAPGTRSGERPRPSCAPGCGGSWNAGCRTSGARTWRPRSAPRGARSRSRPCWPGRRERRRPGQPVAVAEQPCGPVRADRRPSSRRWRDCRSITGRPWPCGTRNSFRGTRSAGGWAARPTRPGRSGAGPSGNCGRNSPSTGRCHERRRGRDPDDPLAEAMAAYDDLLATGRETPPEALGEAVDPPLLPEWNRLAAFLTLVEKAWPRDADARRSPDGAGPCRSGPDADRRTPRPPARSAASGSSGRWDKGASGSCSSPGTRRYGARSRSRSPSPRPW